MSPPGNRRSSAQSLWYGLIVVLFGALTLLVLAWNQPLSGSVALRPGQVAPYDVVAPRQTSYVSELLTQQARERAADAVPEQFDSAIGSVRREQVLRLRQLIGDMTSTREDDTVPLDGKVGILTAMPELGLSMDSATAMLSLENADWDHVALEAPQALDRALRDEIREGDLTSARARVAATVSADLSEPAAAVAVELVQAMLRPTSYANAALTEQMREEARQAIAPQTVTIERGQTILRAGDIASSEDVEALEQIGLLGGEWDWWEFARAFAFAVALTLVTAGAIFRMHSDSSAAWREAGILMLLIVVWLVAARLMILPHDWLPYLYPLAALSMLVACLVNVRTALILTTAFALLVHFLSGNTNDGLGAYMLVGGWVGALVLGRAERISDFLWAALAVIVANLTMLAAFQMPFDTLSNTQLLQLVFVAVLNGGLSASIALLGYYALGNLFGLTTSLQLNELSRPTHPLLRQLLLKAPGTYHHTIVVSNLSERAAAAIGADALLARVGAYYHDIGKTVRPYFFAENIADGASPHDRLDPLTSAKIIISHVADGIDLAQKYRLPRRIQDFIREHHGSSTVQYFYVRALRDAIEGETVQESDFRYAGPKPRTRETAVLALADTCEAAVRAMHPGSRDDIASLVNRLIDERVAEGELSESNLTFGDLEAIREVFVQVLQGVHHPRVIYPENETGAEVQPLPALGVDPEDTATGENGPLDGDRAAAGAEQVEESQEMVYLDKAG